MTTATWRDVLREPGSRRHIALLYRNGPLLPYCVAAWAAAGLATGGGAVFVGREPQRRAIGRELRTLGVDVDERVDAGRLVFLDADATLQALGGSPEPSRDLFRRVLGAELDRLRAACVGRTAEVRAWGEMVDVLWERGSAGAAVRLEALWNELLAERDVRLLCSYCLDGMLRGAHPDADAASCAHDDVLVELESGDLEAVAGRALRDVFRERSPASIALRRALLIGRPTPHGFLLGLTERQDASHTLSR